MSEVPWSAALPWSASFRRGCEVGWVGLVTRHSRVKRKFAGEKKIEEGLGLARFRFLLCLRALLFVSRDPAPPPCTVLRRATPPRTATGLAWQGDRAAARVRMTRENAVVANLRMIRGIGIDVVVGVVRRRVPNQTAIAGRTMVAVIQ
ncbi:uncharacterized protein LOC109795805 [Cajanus cajan]|uniref:uncharacterized protein LOC109795805 n=1 Tax=Cajanus cajan TaxID=3821 RepID=UPI0010FADCD0|nr:uncharacterized protein LOC109795805 [Cajanus cajan]